MKNAANFYLSVENPTAEINKIFNQVDADKNGKIDYNEFITAAI